MSEDKGQNTEVCGQRFRVVKWGLDADEVSAFIGGLLDQNSDLQSRLEHLSSLRRLAEKIVIRAEDQAERMKAEAEERAQERLLLAEQRAREIMRAAAEQADALKSPRTGGPNEATPENT
jgi:hypothetical protein